MLSARVTKVPFSTYFYMLPSWQRIPGVVAYPQWRTITGARSKAYGSSYGNGV
ncbi:hypothetical protein IFR05_015815 [Cadophora sp. M221]|nr:hypothetical protein IFR05_015815 [Cadophora sp. M221]